MNINIKDINGKIEIPKYVVAKLAEENNIKINKDVSTRDLFNFVQNILNHIEEIK